jgi:cytidine deaminase
MISGMPKNETVKLSELPLDVREAAYAAGSLRSSAYAPFSHFHVSAAVLLNSGATIKGVNYESASYGLTLCAERAAIATTQAAGKLNELKALIIIAGKSKESDYVPTVAPCGACRQWIAELAERLNNDFPVYCFDSEGKNCLVLTAKTLLPNAFLSSSLN